MSNKSNLLKNVLSLGLVQIATYLLPLVSIPIIVRIIGPGNYGVINYYTSFTAYFILLINYGFDYSGTRVIAIAKDDKDKRNRHFTKIIYAKCILFLVSSVIFFVAVSAVSKSAAETKVAIYTYLITISWVLSPNWFYQGMQQLTKVSLFSLVSKVLFTFLVLVIIRQKEDYVWQPLILSLTQIFVSVVSLIFAIKKFGITIKKTNLKAVIDLLWEDRMIFFSMIALNLYTDTNIVILGFFESKVHVGYFTAAWRLIFVFLSIISFPVSQAMFPFIADSFAENIDKGIVQIKRALPIIIYMSLGLSVFLYLSAKIMILGFYGARFTDSILIFRILAMVPVLSFINTILGLQTMVNLKMDKAFFRIVLAGGIFSVGFNILIIRLYGYIGCSFSWTVTEIVIALASHLYLKSKGYHLFDLNYFRPASVWLELRTIASNLIGKE